MNIASMQPAPTNIPRRQHTVSQGILRKFTDPTTKKLESYDLKYEKSAAKYPAQVGYVWDFVTHEPIATEQRWQSVENEFVIFVKALENRTLLDNDVTIDLAKRIIALHVIRSLTRWELQELIVERANAGVIKSLLEKPQQLEVAVYKRTGLYSAGPEILQVQAEREARAAVATLDNHVFWQSRLMANIK